jgi:hypothetical protein
LVPHHHDHDPDPDHDRDCDPAYEPLPSPTIEAD